jgi:hypothetical protein
MTEKVTIYIPTTAKDSKAVVEYVEKRLSNEYGGVTTVEGKGKWVDENNNLITDNVKVISSVGEINEDTVETLAKFVKKALNEDSVLYEITPVNDVTFV